VLIVNLISCLVFPKRKYGGNTSLGISVVGQVKLVANKEVEIWGCYKAVSELRLTDLKACLKGNKKKLKD